jgi:hypothetical protein
MTSSEGGKNVCGLTARKYFEVKIRFWYFFHGCLACTMTFLELWRGGIIVYIDSQGDRAEEQILTVSK